MKGQDGLIVMEGVTKRYGRRRALDGLDLEISAGSIFGLVGSNGAGKTTTMSILAGITRRDGGTVRVFGESGFDPSAQPGMLSLLPQDSQLSPYARVRQLLTFYAELQGLQGARKSEEVDHVINWVHLSDRADSKIRTLSHGMKRRFMIAQAFLGSPQIVILDEPLSGLDPKEVVNVRDIIRGQRGRQTIIISSHNLHEIEKMCDHVAFIENGRRARQGSVASITGRMGTIRYLLAQRDFDAKILEQVLPGARLEVSHEHLPSGAGSLLVCGYDPEKFSVEQVNALVLNPILSSGTGVISVEHGDELETVYMHSVRK